MEVTLELPENLARTLEVNVSKWLHGVIEMEAVVTVRSRDELLAEEFDELVKAMEKQGFKFYSLFGYEGLEITFVKEEGDAEEGGQND
jgi:hypothetical protein